LHTSPSLVEEHELCSVGLPMKLWELLKRGAEAL
jgi:hypothetical protein